VEIPDLQIRSTEKFGQGPDMMEGKRGTRLREPATSASEGEEILMVTIGATNSGKSLMKVAAFQVGPLLG
jgi:hypothetical protein